MGTAGGYGALLDALRGVRWPARRPARGATTGAHPSRLTGVSPEFTEYRPYRQGDDPRRLDWRLLARTDRAYLRITSDRATLGTVIAVDASASMDFPRGAGSKWAHARAVAVGLAAVAHADGDPVGLVVAGARGAVTLPPRTRRGVVGEIARALDAVEPGGGAPLAPAVAALGVPRIAVVSDFLGDDADALLRAARERVSAGGEAFAVHVVAREELEPPASAMMATDPEHPEVARALAEGTRDEYVRAFAAWREALARDWLGAGASYRLCATDEPAARAVREIARPPALAAARSGA
jgi:uncharacterized protein (DUF58 family)